MRTEFIAKDLVSKSPSDAPLSATATLAEIAEELLLAWRSRIMLTRRAISSLAVSVLRLEGQWGELELLLGTLMMNALPGTKRGTARCMQIVPSEDSRPILMQRWLEYRGGGARAPPFGSRGSFWSSPRVSWWYVETLPAKVDSGLRARGLLCSRREVLAACKKWNVLGPA